jgi:transposase
VRHRAKLVGLRTNLKCQVSAVLAGAGVQALPSDLFGVGGRELLEQVSLAAAMRAKVNSALRLIDAIDFEIDTFTHLVTTRLRADPGWVAVQTIPGVGPILPGSAADVDAGHGIWGLTCGNAGSRRGRRVSRR